MAICPRTRSVLEGCYVRRQWLESCRFLIAISFGSDSRSPVRRLAERPCWTRDRDLGPRLRPRPRHGARPLRPQPRCKLPVLPRRIRPAGARRRAHRRQPRAGQRRRCVPRRHGHRAAPARARRTRLDPRRLVGDAGLRLALIAGRELRRRGQPSRARSATLRVPPPCAATPKARRASPRVPIASPRMAPSTLRRVGQHPGEGASRSASTTCSTATRRCRMPRATATCW